MEHQEAIEITRKCFSGLCQYAGQVAAAGGNTWDLRTFAVQMTEFWGMDEDGGGIYEQEFDRATAEAFASGTAPELSEETKDEIIAGLQAYRKELECVGGTEDGFYNYREFADRIGVDNYTVRNWEYGVSNPSRKSLQKICAAFGVTVETLIPPPTQPLDGKDISRLLRFQDPLEVAVDCAEGYTLQDMDLGFLMDRREPEGTGMRRRDRGRILQAVQCVP